MNNNILSNILNEIYYCKICSELKNYSKFKTNKHGNINSRIWIVGSNPRDIINEPDAEYWKGKVGIFFRSLISENYRYQLDNLVYFTDAIKCYRENKKNTKKILSRCSKKWLLKEFEAGKPKFILLLGNDAKEAFEKTIPQDIQNTITILKTLHPGYFSKNRKNKNIKNELYEYTQKINSFFDNSFKKSRKNFK